MSYFCSSIVDQQHVKSGKSRLLRFFFFFSEFIICKHLFFERIIWPPHGAYVMENLNTGQAVLESLNAPGFRVIAQGMLKYRDHQSSWSAHYVDFRNRKSAFLCYYQTATRNFYHSAQNARDFIWPYYRVLRSRWCQCLRGYESATEKDSPALFSLVLGNLTSWQLWQPMQNVSFISSRFKWQGTVGKWKP